MFNSSLKSKLDYENSIAFAIEQGKERGMEVGRKQVRTMVATNLIIQMDFSDEQIASVVEEPVSFVKHIREGLKK